MRFTKNGYGEMAINMDCKDVLQSFVSRNDLTLGGVLMIFRTFLIIIAKEQTEYVSI